MRAGLIDEYRLFVQPVILGAGTPFFPALEDRIGLKLLETRTFGSGVVSLRYTTINPRRLREPAATLAEADAVLPDHLDVVVADRRIGRDDGQTLELGLRDQQPVPRIPMNQRQGARPQGMSLLHRQDAEGVPSKQLRQVDLRLCRQLDPPDARLDRYLVQRRGAHKRHGGTIFDDLPCSR
jgi:hypothetical protein